MTADQREAKQSSLTLSSLAYINISWTNENKSYLDNFLPFVLEVLRGSTTPLDQSDIQQGILEKFGLRFPPDVVRALIKRAVKVRKVTRIQDSARLRLVDGISEKLPNVASQRGTALRQQNLVIDRLISFAYDRFDRQWEQEFAERALITYIEDHALPMLSSSVRGEHETINPADESAENYIIASFVTKVADNDPEVFDYLDMMVKGYMLASVLYLDSAGHRLQKFSRTTIYLDTSICLQALGYDGEQARNATTTMLQLARDQNANLACFEHTLKETRGVLRAVKNALSRNPDTARGIRGVEKHLRESNASPMDVEMAIIKLEDNLSALGVSVFPAPEYEEYLNVDERALEETLEKYVQYREHTPLVADLNSLTAVHRIRRGHCNDKLETCRAILLTDNESLVRASRSFFNSGKHEWPLAMVSSSLTTLLWVKSPTAAPELPKRRIMADCISILSPSETFWVALLDEVDRLADRDLIDPNDVNLLIYDLEAQRAIMDLTKGDPQCITGDTVASAVAKTRNEIIEPTKAERDQAIKSLEEEKVRARDAELANGEKDGEIAEMRRRLTSADKTVAMQIKTTEETYHSWADKWKRILRIFLAFVVIASVLAFVAPYLPFQLGWLDTVGSVVVRAIGLCSGVLACIGFCFGGNIDGWIDDAAATKTDNELLRLGLSRNGVSD